MNKIFAVAAAGLATFVAIAANAPAASAENNEFLYSGTGSVLRVTLYEHANMGGHAIYYFGSGNCTTTTTDNDYSKSSMPGSLWNSWDNQVSSYRDYANCDVKFYDGTNFTAANTGWLNGGSAGRNLSSVWNDRASSFRVS
jgi:hypothetical protein